MPRVYQKEDSDLPPAVYYTDNKSKTNYKTVTCIYRCGRKKQIWTRFDNLWEAYLYYLIMKELEALWPVHKRYTPVNYVP